MSIYFQTSSEADFSQGYLDIALCGHYFHGEERFSTDLRDYIKSMPDWSTPVGWTATYESWII